MTIALLPGMDGTGSLFRAFLRRLPDGIDTKVLAYPGSTYLTYEQLADQAEDVIPGNVPYVIIEESFSGPVAVLLATRSSGIFRPWFSFRASSPCRAVVGLWTSKISLRLFCERRIGSYGGLLPDSVTPVEMISEVRDAIAQVCPEVLARRLRGARNAESSSMLRDFRVRPVCLWSDSDRLLGNRGLRGFLTARPDIETVRVAGPHLLVQCSPDASLASLQRIGLFAGSAPVDQQSP